MSLRLALQLYEAHKNLVAHCEKTGEIPPWFDLVHCTKCGTMPTPYPGAPCIWHFSDAGKRLSSDAEDQILLRSGIDAKKFDRPYGPEFLF